MNGLKIKVQKRDRLDKYQPKENGITILVTGKKKQTLRHTAERT